MLIDQTAELRPPSPAAPDRLRIVYIAGDGRCGSTLLDRVLGSLQGVASVNEAHEIWRFGAIENRYCSCRQRFRDCDFWAGVLEDVARTTDVDPPRLLAIQQRYEKSRLYWKVKNALRDDIVPADLTEYLRATWAVMRALARRAGGSVLVDSSKIPTRALLLAACPAFDVQVVHLVRHPAAVVHAWNRAKYDPGAEREMEHHRMLRTLSFWGTRNVLSEMLRRELPYVRLRYEDFVTSPQTALDELHNRFGLPAIDPRVFPSSHEVVLPPIHSISGNPDRYEHGLTRIVADEKWRRGMRRRDRACVDLLTWPALLRYGYRG